MAEAITQHQGVYRNDFRKLKVKVKDKAAWDGRNSDFTFRFLIPTEP